MIAVVRALGHAQKRIEFITELMGGPLSHGHTTQPCDRQKVQELGANRKGCSRPTVARCRMAGARRCWSRFRDDAQAAGLTRASSVACRSLQTMCPD